MAAGSAAGGIPKLKDLVVVLKTVDWHSLGLQLDISTTDLSDIDDQYPQRKIDRKRSAMFEIWLANEPDPSWEKIVTALERMGGHSGIIRTIQRDYLEKSTPVLESRKILDEALLEGYVTMRVIMILLLGMAGVGKTSLKHLLLGLPPPPIRNSTSCAEKPTQVPIRSVAGSRITTDGKWKEASGEKLLMLVARAVLVCERITKKPMSTEEFQHLAQRLAVEEPEGESIDTQPPSSLDQSAASSGENAHRPSASSEAIATIRKKLEQLIEELRDEPTADTAETTVSKWVYCTDCGGQPQFQELLPLFVRNTSAALLVFRMFESLDIRPPAEYYYKGGKPAGVPKASTHTSIESLNRLVHSIQSRPAGGKHTGDTKVIVVGTHKDVLEAKQGAEETHVEEENEKMLRGLFSQFSEKLKLIYYDQRHENVAFPVDTTSRKEHEERIAGRIRNEVEKSVAAVDEDVPVRWYVFERMLQQLAKQLCTGVLSRSACLKIARGAPLCFPVQVFNAALEFFDKLCIFHYYPDTLPDVVFVNSQVPLDKVTELVEHSFLLRQQGDGTPPPLLRGDFQKFRNDGIISLEILKNDCFQQHYVEGLFGPPELLLLLKKLLVVAPFVDLSLPDASSEEHFMPSLLEVIQSEKELEKHRVFSSADPLLFRFPDGSPRAGVFCCLVVHLMKCCGWKKSKLSGEKTPEIARNCVKFRVRVKGVPCEVTLIDSSSYIEVYVEVGKSLRAQSRKCQELFPAIKQSALEGIKAACDALHYTEVGDPELRFFCSQTVNTKQPTDTSAPPKTNVQKMKRHTATFEPGQKYLSCETDGCPGFFGELEDQHKIWFGEGRLAATSCADTNQTTSAAVPTLSEAFHLLLPLAYEWQNIGVLLEPKLPEGALKSIEKDKQNQSRDCLREMLDEWLKQIDPLPSWSALAKAVEKFSPAKAQEIRNLH